MSAEPRFVGAPPRDSHPLSLSPPLPSPASLPRPPSHDTQQSNADPGLSIPTRRAGREEEEEEEAAAEASLPSQDLSEQMGLPEDDGMSILRKRILDVQSQDVVLAEKARLMHGILMEGYERAHHIQLPLRPITPKDEATGKTEGELQRQQQQHQQHQQSPAYLAPLKFFQGSYSHLSAPVPATPTFALTKQDLTPTYAPDSDCESGCSGNATNTMDAPHATAHAQRTASLGSEADEAETRRLGCAHYRRNVKLQCVTCERWYTCRLCHDEAELHVLPRQETKYMLCMLCGHAQRAGEMCTKCGESAARYFCPICKLWDDAPDKSIYHCNDCGLCRVGEGLGKDFFHCKKCGSCISITQEDSHRCREGVMDCDCPICGEYMFTSYKKVVTMKCGHTIHDDCRAEYIKRSYKCPICNKCVENMESMFRRLDKHLEEQPMPEEYENTRAVILCNDCESKTTTKYHWGGLRCEICLSYNTVELHLLNSPKSHGDALPVSEAEPSPDQANGDATAAEGSRARFARTLTVPISPASEHSPSHLPSPPLSASSLRGGDGGGRSSSEELAVHGRSPPRMHSPTQAPVMATPPPGYGRDGYEVDDDSESDIEHEDILGLRRAHRRSFASGNGSDEKDAEEDESDESDSSEESDDLDEDDDDEDDEDDPFTLIGHR